MSKPSNSNNNIDISRKRPLQNAQISPILPKKRRVIENNNNLIKCIVDIAVYTTLCVIRIVNYIVVVIFIS